MKETLIENKIEVSPDMINGDIKNYFALKVKGDRYRPLFADGDIVLINGDLSKQNPGNIYAVEIAGSIELRRFEVRKEENKVCLCGISPNVPPIFLLHSEYKVIGFPVLLTREI